MMSSQQRDRQRQPALRNDKAVVMGNSNTMGDDELRRRNTQRPRPLVPSYIHQLLLASSAFNILFVLSFCKKLQPLLLVEPSQEPNVGRNVINATILGYTPYDKVFGHVHMAKTAGTEINGELAAHFERICGHKGYSYDFFQYNQRVEQSNSTHVEEVAGKDVISKVYEGYNRGRVKPQVMWEIGMEDCDFISLEASWQHWRNVSKMIRPLPLELHVPCRDPLEHFMSQCNERHVVFDCQNKKKQTLKQQIQECLVLIDSRFKVQLTKIPNTVVKCFQPIPMNGYLDYMAQFLQRRRIDTNYVHRITNQPRNKTNECIWNRPILADRILEILLTYDYYRWCAECTGSENDLLRTARG